MEASTNTVSQSVEASIMIWEAHLDRLSAEENQLTSLLSTDEHIQFARLRSPIDRLRRLIARAYLRQILAAILGQHPATLTFMREPSGKPVLSSAPNLWFNVSHAGSHVVYAVYWEGPVGVDIERLDRSRVDLAVARHMFAPEEVVAIEAYPNPERTSAFFRCWTAKEALVKALGVGLDETYLKLNMSRLIYTSNTIITEPHMLTVPYRLCALTVAPGYIATVAAPAGTWSIIHRPWPPI